MQRIKLRVRMLSGLLLLVGLILASGCRAVSEPKAVVTGQRGMAYPEDDRSALELTACVDGVTGEAVSAEDLVAQASAADVVVVGEVHGHEAGLAVASALWRSVLDARPDAVLALEFIERDQQPLLDDWLAAEAPTQPEAFSFAHGPMLMAAKQYGRPVVAANAPRRYVRLARTHGYDHLRGMTPAQRATFVLPEHETTGGYRDRFFEFFEDGVGHAEALTAEEIEGFWRAQMVWDATMADSVLRALDVHGGPVVLVVGRFHVARDGGVMQLLRARRPELKVFSIVMTTSPGPEAEQRAGGEKERAEDGDQALVPLADAVWKF